MRAWARRRSVWILPFGTTCCAGELAAALGPGHEHGACLVYDAALADVLVVAGRVTRAMAPDLRRLFQAMPEPRRVIAFGSCAVTGGAWRGEEVPGGAGEVIPVDVCVPGCPPPPEALARALDHLARR